MNKTENLKLNLPSPDNFADIADLNENFTIIEDSINSINVKTTQVGNSAEAAQTTANSAIANAATAQSAANTALANAAAAQSTANAKQNALDSTQMGNINNPPKGADLGNQGTTAFGQTVQNGAAATFARSDHRHAIPAAPAVPAAANLSSQAAAFGQTARNGTAATFARSDHYHAIPAFNAGFSVGTMSANGTVNLGWRPSAVLVFGYSFSTNFSFGFGNAAMVVDSEGGDTIGGTGVTYLSITNTGFTTSGMFGSSTSAPTATSRLKYIAFR